MVDRSHESITARVVKKREKKINNVKLNFKANSITQQGSL